MAVDETMTKEKLLAQVVESRAELTALLADVPIERWEEPGVEADWSLKDTVAHILSWEVKMIAWLAGGVNDTGPADFPTSNEDIDRMNAGFTAENTHLDVAAVQASFAENGERVLAAVTAVAADDLMTPGKFAWRGERPLWPVVGGNTFWHYAEHIESIRRWLQAGE